MNSLSAVGRMSYASHMLVYPSLFILYSFGYKTYAKKAAEKAEEQAWKDMEDARVVDKDIFNPFTPIPFHNNRELKYAYDHLNMHGYINKNHINVKDYPYKQFHNVYGENNEYLYNWTSTSSNTH